MFKRIRNLLRDESGATAIEYGLIAAGIAVAIIAAVATLGGTLEGLFGEITAGLGTAGLMMFLNSFRVMTGSRGRS